MSNAHYAAIPCPGCEYSKERIRELEGVEKANVILRDLVHKKRERIAELEAELAQLKTDYTDSPLWPCRACKLERLKKMPRANIKYTGKAKPLPYDFSEEVGD